jgi:hypothetical protein
MTSPDLSRRKAVLASLGTTFLAACGSGGGSGGGSTTVRAINLTSDLASVDLYVAGNKQFSALTTGTLSSYATFDANTYAINVNSAGNVSALFTGSYTLSKDAHFTAVVWGPQAALRVSALPEDYDNTLITAGNAKLRVLNATVETGPVDVFLTAPGADLTAGPALISNVPSGSLTGFFDIAAGTGSSYELRITSRGNPKDVRLDIGAVTLTAGQYQTLVITSGAGATLVNGEIIVQQGAVTALVNGQSRVRFAASVDGSAAVTVTVAKTALSPGGLISTAQSAYTSVTAGNVALAISINGVVQMTTPQALTLVSGTDYTLLVYGPASNPQVSIIVDDNRLPLLAGKTKIRVVNGVAALDALSLTVDNVLPVETSYVSAGTASTYALIDSNLSANIAIGSGSTPVVYASLRPPGDQLVSQAVYTLFVLSGATKPVAVLRKDTA